MQVWGESVRSRLRRQGLDPLVEKLRKLQVRNKPSILAKEAQTEAKIEALFDEAMAILEVGDNKSDVDAGIKASYKMAAIITVAFSIMTLSLPSLDRLRIPNNVPNEFIPFMLATVFVWVWAFASRNMANTSYKLATVITLVLIVFFLGNFAASDQILHPGDWDKQQGLAAFTTAITITWVSAIGFNWIWPKRN